MWQCTPPPSVSVRKLVDLVPHWARLIGGEGAQVDITQSFRRMAAPLHSPAVPRADHVNVL